MHKGHEILHEDIDLMLVAAWPQTTLWSVNQIAVHKNKEKEEIMSFKIKKAACI
jgi:hypothetical protein